MKSLWQATEETILENAKTLESEEEADVCIIGRWNYRNIDCILLKQRKQKSNSFRKRKNSRENNRKHNSKSNISASAYFINIY